jgi:hypothetical protein
LIEWLYTVIIVVLQWFARGKKGKRDVVVKSRALTKNREKINLLDVKRRLARMWATKLRIVVNFAVLKK